MERCLVVTQSVEGRAEFRLECEERSLRLLLCSVTGLVSEVELGAVARRQANRFTLSACERMRQLSSALPVECRALTQLDGRLVMRDADEDDAHVAKWVTGRARRTTATSTKPARTR